MHSVRFIKSAYVAAFLLGALIALLLAQPVRAAAAADLSAVAAPAASGQDA